MSVGNSDVKFACPGCKLRIKVSVEFVGAKSTCPDCSQKFRIPAPPDEVKFTCGKCKTKLALHKSYVGAQIGCPECRVDILVPDPQAQLNPPPVFPPAKSKAPAPPVKRPPSFKESTTPVLPPKSTNTSPPAKPATGPTTRPPNLGGGSIPPSPHPNLPPTPGCPQCGGKLSADAILCVLCGYQVESGQTLDIESAAPPAPKKKPKRGKVNTGSKREIKIREEHIGQERSIRGAGTLFLASGTIFLLTGVISLLTDFKPDDATETPEEIKLISAISAALGFLTALVGWGIRQLKPWSRLPFILLNIPGLLGFPLGTLISFYCIRMTIGETGKYILSEEYQRIVSRTQGVKLRTSIFVWLILALFAGIILTVCLAVLLR